MKCEPPALVKIGQRGSEPAADRPRELVDRLYTSAFFELTFFLGELDHPLQCNVCEMLGFVIDNDLVDDVAVDEVFHCPGEVLRGDAVHGRTHAEVGSEQADLFIGKACLQTIDEIYLGSDRPF